MDSPSQRQPRLVHADPSTRDTQAFRQGSSSEVRKGLETPPNLQLETERLTTSAVSMERRGVVAGVELNQCPWSRSTVAAPTPSSAATNRIAVAAAPSTAPRC